MTIRKLLPNLTITLAGEDRQEMRGLHECMQVVRVRRLGDVWVLDIQDLLELVLQMVSWMDPCGSSKSITDPLADGCFAVQSLDREIALCPISCQGAVRLGGQYPDGCLTKSSSDWDAWMVAWGEARWKERIMRRGPAHQTGPDPSEVQ